MGGSGNEIIAEKHLEQCLACDTLSITVKNIEMSLYVDEPVGGQRCLLIGHRGLQWTSEWKIQSVSRAIKGCVCDYSSTNKSELPRGRAQ